MKSEISHCVRRARLCYTSKTRFIDHRALPRARGYFRPGAIGAPARSGQLSSNQSQLNRLTIVPLTSVLWIWGFPRARACTKGADNRDFARRPPYPPTLNNFGGRGRQTRARTFEIFDGALPRTLPTMPRAACSLPRRFSTVVVQVLA